MRALLGVPMAGALLLGLTTVGAPADALIPPDTACRSGKVALTFDDGPHRDHTARLLSVLRRHRAQVTFYVQGQNAVRHPDVLRTMVRDGHAVENHSWDHPNLTALSDAAVRSQLTRTTAAIREATGRTSEFFRPPYGATNARIVGLARDANLAQQLWTVDSRDWTGLSAGGIADRVLAGVEKRRRNVVLLHDGVANSARTVEAVPEIVTTLRERGFCLVPQQAMMVRQEVRIVPRRVTEPKHTRSVTRKVVIRLDSPAQRPGRVRLTPVNGTAKAGRHYRRPARWVRFERGQTKAVVKVRIHRVPAESATRVFRLRLHRPHDLRIAKGQRSAKVVIRDNGVVAPPPPSPEPAP